MYAKKLEEEIRQIDAKDIDSDIKTIFKYNQNASPASVYANDGIQIIENNIDLYKQTIDLIRSAKKQISCITFIIKDSVFFSTFCAELIKKAKQGVKVAFIYD
ncbi:MAG: hypothetical protein HUJ68_05565 [Clostridia bacterium]|nr:hypothetical protein [Clostridia bacterium]